MAFASDTLAQSSSKYYYLNKPKQIQYLKLPWNWQITLGMSLSSTWLRYMLLEHQNNQRMPEISILPRWNSNKLQSKIHIDEQSRRCNRRCQRWTTFGRSRFTQIMLYIKCSFIQAIDGDEYNFIPPPSLNITMNQFIVLSDSLIIHSLCANVRFFFSPLQPRKNISHHEIKTLVILVSWLLLIGLLFRLL